MAFAGAYEFSGFDSWVSDFLKSAERKVRKEVKRIEQDIRPVVKTVLPYAGAIVGSILLPGVGTALGTSLISTGVGATIGGAVVKEVQSSYESHEVKKDIAAQESAIQAQTAQTIATAEALKLQSAEQQQVAQAGFFSKPSGLMTAALAIGLIAYVPPLKPKKARRRRR